MICFVGCSAQSGDGHDFVLPLNFDAPLCPYATPRIYRYRAAWLSLSFSGQPAVHRVTKVHRLPTQLVVKGHPILGVGDDPDVVHFPVRVPQEMEPPGSPGSTRDGYGWRMFGRYRIVQRVAVCIALACACVVGATPALASWPAQPSLVETITTSGSPFGAAMSPNGAQAWFTSYNGNSVRFFDTSTRQELPGSPLSVGTTPWDVVFSPDGNHAWVSNYQVASPSGTGTTVSIIDTTRSPPTVTGAVIVGTGPQGMAMSPDGTRLWVANYSSAGVSVINTRLNPPSVVATVALPAGASPNAVAISPDGMRALVTDYLGNVYVISTSTFAVLGAAAIGDALVDVVFNNDGTRAWVSGARVYAIDVSTNTPVRLNTSTVSAGGGLALAPDGSRLWVVAQFGNALDLIDPITLQAFSGARLTFGQQPQQVILTPSGTEAWVSGFLNNTIGVVSTGYVPSDSDDPSQRPRAPLQEFAVAPGTAAEQCADLAPESVDWPALVSLRQVGWTLSYASWPHGGTGGWVCSRQPVYISGAWTFTSNASLH